VRRRTFVLSALGGVITVACARLAPRPESTAVPRSAEFDRWTQEAQGILSDSLQSLRTFDIFHAFRVSTVADSGLKQQSQLAWDPPTGVAWEEATHVARGLHGRAEQLAQAVTTARIDSALWRDQRTVAEATQRLVDLGDALAVYRDRLDGLAPGDAANALQLLDNAWAQYDSAAAGWRRVRAEAFNCSN